jgi:hypothetical protein
VGNKWVRVGRIRSDLDPIGSNLIYLESQTNSSLTEYTQYNPIWDQIAYNSTKINLKSE